MAHIVHRTLEISGESAAADEGVAEQHQQQQQQDEETNNAPQSDSNERAKKV
jgi:hypothetical protein